MKLLLNKWLRLLCPALLIVVTTAASHGQQQQQDARLQIGNLDSLEARASQVIDFSIDGRLLQVAIKFLNPKDPDQAKIRELVSGLKGIYVRSYEFDKPDEFSVSDVAPISAQLKGPGWSRMVGVRSAREQENIEVYTMLDGDKVGGIAVIATEAKQLTVINIVGPIDLEKLAALEGNFRIPKLHIKHDLLTPKE
ncbi:MAG TPA: DUF4252 domain-containing protein [Pyrinomonadaceae bacterium]|jgi:hypothetical protein